MIVQFPAHISKIETMADRSIRLKVDSMLELSPKDKAQVFEFQSDKPLWVALAEVAVEREQLDIPEIIKDTEEEKSPSKKLKDRMFVYYREKNGNGDGFNQWYADALEKIGNKYLEKLN